MDARACATDGLASGRGREAGRRRRLRQSPGGAHHLLVAGLQGEPRADAQDAGPGPRRLGWAPWSGTRQGQSRFVGQRRPAQPRMSSPGCRVLCHEPGLGYRHCAFHRCQWLLAPVAGPSPGWAAPRWPRVGVGRWQPGTSSSQRRSRSPSSASAACTGEAGSLPGRRSAGCSPSRVWPDVVEAAELRAGLHAATRSGDPARAGCQRRVTPAGGPSHPDSLPACIRG